MEGLGALLVLLLLCDGFAIELIFTQNSTGSYCYSEKRSFFQSDNVIREHVDKGKAKLLVGGTWTKTNLSSVAIGYESLAQTKLANDIPLSLLSKPLIVPWKSDVIEVEVLTKKSDTYTITIKMSDEIFDVDCTKHCHLQKLRIERRNTECIVTFLDTTISSASGAEFFTLDTNQPGIHVRVLDIGVYVPPKNQLTALGVNIETTHPACLNYWLGKRSRTLFSLHVPGVGNYQMNKPGWNVLALKGNLNGSIVMKNSGIEDPRKKISFLLLDTLMCESDAVFTVEAVEGCMNQTNSATLTLNATCPFLKCECGTKCKICTTKGCGCDVEEDLSFCTHFAPSTVRPTTTTTKPSTTHPPSTTRGTTHPPSTTRGTPTRSPPTKSPTTATPDLPKPTIYSGHLILVIAVWTSIGLVMILGVWLVVIYVRRRVLRPPPDNDYEMPIVRHVPPVRLVGTQSGSDTSDEEEIIFSTPTQGPPLQTSSPHLKTSPKPLKSSPKAKPTRMPTRMTTRLFSTPVSSNLRNKMK